MYQLTKKKIGSRQGMTMAEMLTVVAIIIILAGVAFIAIMNYQRSMALLERNTIAKELFIAAQNHLTVARGENYLGDLEVLNSGDQDAITNTFGAVVKETPATQTDDNSTGAGGTGTDEDGNSTGTGGTGTDENGGSAEASATAAYYIVYLGKSDHHFPEGGAHMYEQMLPFGAIEETVRVSGCYIIGYQPSVGKILGVFYWTSGDRFGHDYDQNDDTYQNLVKNYTGSEANNEKRRKLADGSVLGWYGGEDVETLQDPLVSPRIDVENGNRLLVKSWDKNSTASDDGIILRLIITGKSSGAQRYKDVKRNTTDISVFRSQSLNSATANNEHTNETIVLDDITAGSDAPEDDHHFESLFNPSGTNTSSANTSADSDYSGFIANENLQKKFIPGEDLEIRAVTFSTTKIGSMAESGVKVANSLFDSISTTQINEDGTPASETYYLNGNPVVISGSGGGSDGIPDTAYIKCIRHLENLDKTISCLDRHDGNGTANNPDKIKISKAIQIGDMDWTDFTEDTTGQTVYYSSGVPTTEQERFSPNNPARNFKPVDLDNSFTYDGKGFSIKNVIVARQSTDVQFDDAGLFGSVKSDGEIENLKLIDFKVKGAKNAGSLAGSLTSTNVKNVIAINSDKTKARENIITADENAGGLIGKTTRGTIEFSAAAMMVGNLGEESSDPNVAGGLIGNVAGSTIKDCYAAGQTDRGEYYTHKNNGDRDTILYTVTGKSTAGGLVGAASAATMKDCYTTAAVIAENTNGKAGGFVGSASGTIKDCYCTGLVSGELTVSKDGKTRSNDNAFIGEFNGDSTNVTGNHYYAIVNENAMKDSKNNVISIEYKLSGFTTEDGTADRAGVTPFDDSRQGDSIFNSISTSGVEAHPYDEYLESHFTEGDAETFYYLKPVTNKKKYFVSEHYGDWPAPEILIINTH